ncbi:HEAT repeat domain-containing protein [Leptospira sp. 2 VSF19]|uniref:HEAT repeat domain-containing protein n=1 Tax=Leptospira soteropolitanensis TaxID=2950025 RepID=A0AAW5VH60_9LEPT|nr:HEAT repeat domain-containing protein [Leptospira soteropolitanensis]MCW7494489.1 HEAT repeat domain-containing protein [Leptospira soteropolitanensis]MCW7502083.1 HEAT repeat domain-containing protein [Leptospira soteropolitanensis]MCW7524335.1 HEAT repeat domain-containing protein [Leptospira soteropolitanensis]MCW7528200.1 HEAT repeat domain-containing protein [Leptospira soteropolitanensis]MCW7532053.1 HEAT repeat domain-containing protein [Leptospira soteropolitanensis]
MIRIFGWILCAVLVPVTLMAESDERFFEIQQTRLASSDVFEIRDAIDKLTFVKSSLGIRDIISALEGTSHFPTSPRNAPAVKFYAAQALGKKGDKIAIPYLIKTYQKESNNIPEHNPQKVRTWKDGVADSSSPSSPYFYDDGEIPITLACGEILRALGSLPLTAESESTIKSALTSPNFYLRSSAADAVYLSGKTEFLSSLLDTLGKETVPYAKISLLSAVVGLERLPNQNYKSVLESLTNKDPEVRAKASDALRRLDFRTSAPYLEKVIQSENNAKVLKQMKSDYQFLVSFHAP